ncbi:LuxR C-terminal-related transcriptional regulator [Streptomyces filamentosus]|uniref:helix-turn-helix transcriptional regulator n=1 Tax=Streptomyces filamentosus TaxID=67294 RepID=UPI0016750D4D|nr:LuxR C-terminal-related transcriptional regulator [Streptomyces filamentosus]
MTSGTGPPAPYGRDRELALLAGLLHAAGPDGGERVVCVAGGPGEGRSGLLARAARDFPGPAHLVGAPGRRVPWSGTRALLAALAPSGAAARRAGRLARGPGGVAAALAAVLPGRGPVLLCLDDLPLWDAHSRAALAAHWRAPDPRGAAARVRWLVAAAPGRPLPVPERAPLVRLERLARPAARALLAGPDGRRVGGAVAERLLDEAAGHPGVLAEAVRRLPPAVLAGTAPAPVRLVGDDTLAAVYGGLLGALPADGRRLLGVVARACGTPDGPYEPDGPCAADPPDDVREEAYRTEVGTALALARALRVPVEALDGLVAAGLLRRRGDELAFPDPFLRRAAGLLGAVREEGAKPGGCAVPAGTAEPGGHPAEPTGPALRGPSLPALPSLPSLPDARHERHRADRLGPPPAVRARSGAARGRELLARGFAALAGGPVMDAHESFAQAAKALGERCPAEAADARFLAMEAAWAAGDVGACLAALDLAPAARGTERAFAEGLRAALTIRPDRARTPLARVVAGGAGREEPRLLLRAGAAALVLGDVAAAARLHGRALARARAERRASLLPRILEHLAYAELRAGRYSRAGHAAREGLRAARATGQHNSAAHQHAVLALVASVTGDGPAAAGHAERALAIGRPHGLAQAVTLAEWALARADSGAGLAERAAARLAPLVGPGPRGGHFALRMLAVPCFVEAAVASGQEAEARAATEEYARWAAYGLDRPAPAQLARCRALLAPRGEEARRWFGEALRCHEESGNDFERARTLFAYGVRLRRLRRPGEARGPLRDALVAFERAAAEGWARQARAELRATGAAGGRAPEPAALASLTPQQQRIARLVADGATNREVAARLSLSPRTVDHHLRGVYARLQLRSRVELSALVAEARG